MLSNHTVQIMLNLLSPLVFQLHDAIQIYQRRQIYSGITDEKFICQFIQHTNTHTHTHTHTPRTLESQRFDS